MKSDDVAYPAAFASKKNDTHWRPGEVTWGEMKEWLEHPKSRKDVDGYILATLKQRSKIHVGHTTECSGGYHRDGKSVERRSAVLALDIDHPEDDFDMLVDVVLAGHAYILHTTYSSTPSEPRYRLLVPVDRDMSPYDFSAASQSLAQRLGYDNVDRATFQATRFMYKPSARKPEWFSFTVEEGEPLRVDDLLDSLEVVDSEVAAGAKPGRNKRNPYEIEDPIGAFNRVYDDWDELIEKFDLPYETESEGRWHLIGASSQGGLTTIPEPGFVNSFHTNDPAYGLNSAFDLVRLHWFSDLDENVKSGTPINRLPSVDAMKDLATGDPQVTLEILKGIQDFNDSWDELIGDDSEDDPDSVSWKTKLQLLRNGTLKPGIANWDVIMRHDPVFQLLHFNQLSMSVDAHGDLPWRKVGPLNRTFDGKDVTSLRFYLEREYNTPFGKELAVDLVDEKATKRQFNPVLEYLERLEWDGVARVETCLPGAEDTPYNRLVARKVLAGAVARMFDPGCKWDHTLVLHGSEGRGKSTWIERMANVGHPERQTYMYTLGAINNKDTLLAMHMSWIVVADEGHSLRKSDNDALKEFLTRNNDVFRAPYDKETVVHPRRCVIWSTTNDETFLRRQEGNRRFLMVKVEEKFDIDSMTPELVDQLWAEAVQIYKSGERIWLDDDEAKLAEFERREFVEEDSLAGVIEAYLERPVPDNWWTMSKQSRVNWSLSFDPEFDPVGSVKIEKTCTHQLWEEAFGQRIIPTKVHLREIQESLRSLGWVALKKPGHLPGYGTQRIWVREEDDLL